MLVGPITRRSRGSNPARATFLMAKKERLILGVDEAGRGPVIGPLVISGVLIKKSKVSKLQKIGVKDSKKLTPKKRENLFRKIKAITKYKIIKIKVKNITFLLHFCR